MSSLKRRFGVKHVLKKKPNKIVVARNYELSAINGYKFTGQRSFRCINKSNRGRKTEHYKMMGGWGVGGSEYGRHSVYPGLKVWIIRKHKLTGQLSVDYDFIDEMFAFSDVGHPLKEDVVFKDGKYNVRGGGGGLHDYWLRSYGIGHGLDKSDFFSTKAQAKIALCKVPATRWENFVF
jgi:hypothetical protein